MTNDQNIVRGRHLESLAAATKRFTLEQNLALNQSIQAQIAQLETGGDGDVFTGATSSTPGVIGYVPAPAAGDNTKFLRGDGTWVIPTDTNTTYSAATTTSSGLMSYTDKRKLNNLASITSAGANIAITNGVISATNTTYSVATTSANGLMSSTDKAKLNNLASITSAGANITISNGTISGTANTTYTAGSNITISGTTISGTANTTYSVATTSANGLMSSTDKAKLNNLASITSAGTNITISSGVISAAGVTFVTDSAFTSMLNSVFA